MAKNIMSLLDKTASLEEQYDRIDNYTYSYEEDVVEVIENDAIGDELQDTETKITAASDAVGGLADNIVPVQTQVAVNKEILQDPEDKTPEYIETNLQASAEALNDALLSLGGRKLKDTWKRKHQISLEALDTNIERLRYTTEGLGDLASNMWEKLKEMFRKMIDFFKRMFTKMESWFGVCTKRFKYLLEKYRALDETKLKEFKLNSEGAEKAANMAPTFLSILAAGLRNSDYIKELEDGINQLTLANLKNNKPPFNKSIGQKIAAFAGYTFTSEGEGDVLFSAYIVKKKCFFISSIGNVEDVESDMDKVANFIKNRISSIKKDAIIADLEAGMSMSKNWSKIVKTIYKNLNDALKEIDKDKKEALKGDTQEGKAETRKEAAKEYKCYTKCADLYIRETKSNIQDMGTFYARLYKVITTGKHTEDGKAVQRDED